MNNLNKIDFEGYKIEGISMKIPKETWTLVLTNNDGFHKEVSISSEFADKIRQMHWSADDILKSFEEKEK